MDLTVATSLMKIINKMVEIKESKEPLTIEGSECSDDLQYMTKCGHSYYNDDIKRWFIKNNTCPKCKTIIISNKIRKLCTKNEYKQINNEYSNYKFLLYLLGANYNKKVDVDKMLKLTTDDNIEESEVFMVENYFLDNYIEFSKKVKLVLMFLIIFGSLFLNDLIPLNWVRFLLFFHITNYELLYYKGDYSRKFLYLNVSSRFIYPIYIIFTNVGSYIYPIISYLYIDNILIKNISLLYINIHIIELIFLSFLCLAYIRLFLRMIFENYKSIIDSEYDGKTNYGEQLINIISDFLHQKGIICRNENKIVDIFV